MGDLALPISWGALISVGIASFVIPYITAFATSPTANPWVKSGVAFVLAGLTALADWAISVKGVPDWKAALGVFFMASIGAAGVRKTYTDGTKPLILAQNSGFQLGATPVSPGQGEVAA